MGGSTRLLVKGLGGSGGIGGGGKTLGGTSSKGALGLTRNGGGKGGRKCLEARRVCK